MMIGCHYLYQHKSYYISLLNSYDVPFSDEQKLRDFSYL